MKGKCLCGAIEIETETVKEVGLCHCSMCRAWSTGPMYALHCGKNIKIHGKGSKFLLQRMKMSIEKKPKFKFHILINLLLIRYHIRFPKMDRRQKIAILGFLCGELSV